MATYRSITPRVGTHTLYLQVLVLILLSRFSNIVVGQCEVKRMHFLTEECVRQLETCGSAGIRTVTAVDATTIPEYVRVRVCDPHLWNSPLLPALLDAYLDQLPVTWFLTCPTSIPQTPRFLSQQLMSVFTEGIGAILQQYKPKNLVYIFDSSQEPLAVQLRQTLTGTESTTEVHLSIMDFSNQIGALLDATSNLRDTTPYNILYIVYLNRQKLQKLLTKVNNHDRVSDEQAVLTLLHYWIFILEEDLVNDYLSNVGKITNAVVMTANSDNRDSIIKTLSDELLIYYKRMDHSYVFHRHICFSSANTSQRANTKVSQISWPTPQITVKLYNTGWGRGLKRNLEQLTSWNSHYIEPPKNMFPNRRYGLNGQHLTVSTISYPPFMEITSLNGTASYKGLLVDMIEVLAEAANFTYTLVDVPDGKFGAVDDTGQWVGMVGQVVSKKADINLAPLVIIPEREAVIDFSTAYHFDQSTTIYLKPAATDSQMYLFLKPLRLELWLLLLPALIITSLVLNLVGVKQLYSCSGAKCSISFLHHAWSCLGAFVNQGSTQVPVTWRSRIVFISWWAFCIIMVATYTANLIAYLTVTVEPPPPFTTYQELCDQQEYVFGILGGSNTEIELHVAKDGPRHCLYKKLKDLDAKGFPVLSEDHDVHISSVKQGGYAYLLDFTGASLAMAEDCRLTSLKEPYSSGTQYAVGMQKNSAYKFMFDKVIRKMHKGGLLKKWKKKHWPSFKGCQKQDMSTPISVMHILGVIIMLSVLLALSVLVLIVEILLESFNRVENTYFSNEKSV